LYAFAILECEIKRERLSKYLSIFNPKMYLNYVILRMSIFWIGVCEWFIFGVDLNRFFVKIT